MRSLALGLILVIAASAHDGEGWDLQRVVSGDTFVDARDRSVEARVVRADARGGEATFKAACPEGGSHAHSYRCTWDFDHDLSHVEAGLPIRAAVRIVRDDRGACAHVPAGAPSFGILVGSPQAVLGASREDHDLDLGAFDARGPARVSAPERGGAEGTLDAVASDRGGVAGCRGVLDLVLWTGRNHTIHVVYLFAPRGGEAAPSTEQVERVLEAAVGAGKFDRSMDADGDGRATSWDAMVMWQHVIAAEAHAKEAASAAARPREVTIPAVVGTSATEAKGALLAEGIEVRFDGLGQGEGDFVVERQDPAPKSRVERGSMVALTLARRAEPPAHPAQPANPPEPPSHPHHPPAQPENPPEQPPAQPPKQPEQPPAKPPEPEGIEMPNFAGRAAAEARGAMPEGLVASFVIAARDPADASQQFTVASQSVAAGTRVPKGTRVVLAIFRGWREPATTVPDVSGRSKREAMGILRAAGLGVREVGSGGPAPDPSKAGLVAGTTPAAGEAVPGDRAVTIHLYGPHEMPQPPKPPEQPPQEPPAQPPQQPPPAPEQPKGPPPEAAPFMGTWKGTWYVEDAGKDAWLGPAKQEVEVTISVSFADGELKVERAGSDAKMTAKVEGGGLVVEWPLEGGTARMDLRVDKRGMQGGVAGVNADGSANGIARVRMKRGR